MDKEAQNTTNISKKCFFLLEKSRESKGILKKEDFQYVRLHFFLIQMLLKSRHLLTRVAMDLKNVKYIPFEEGIVSTELQKHQDFHLFHLRKIYFEDRLHIGKVMPWRLCSQHEIQKKVFASLQEKATSFNKHKMTALSNKKTEPAIFVNPTSKPFR